MQPSERETLLNMAGDDHSTWIVFSDDEYMMRRLDKLADGQPVGLGKEYRLRADQVLIRKGKRQVSTAQREQSSRNLAQRAKILGGVGSLEVKEAA